MHRLIELTECIGHERSCESLGSYGVELVDLRFNEEIARCLWGTIKDVSKSRRV